MKENKIMNESHNDETLCEKPSIEIIEMEVESNILAGSGSDSSGDYFTGLSGGGSWGGD